MPPTLHFLALDIQKKIQLCPFPKKVIPSTSSMAHLKKKLGFYQGLALYLAAVLGTGILVTPLMAWNESGSASLIAWIILGFLGFTLAWTFASVGSQEPDAGGVQAIVGRVFGSKIEGILRYLIFFSVPAGGVAASHILAHHLCAAFLLPLTYIPLFTFGIWIFITCINYYGIEVSSSIQLVLSSVLVILLLMFVVLATPTVERASFLPFFTHGYAGLGQAGVIIFWSFLGWEAIAHLAEEFENPQKNMMKAAIVASILVGVLYFAVSFVLIGSGITTRSTGLAPLVILAGDKLGVTGRVTIGIVAAIVCVGTINAYVAGLSRLCYSMARENDLPKFFAKLSSDGTPRNALLLLFFLNCTALLIQWFFKIDLKYFFLIPNFSFLVLYILGCLAAAKLLRGKKKAVWAAYFSAFVCACIMPFALGVWVVPVTIAGIAFVKLHFFKKPTR